MYDLALIGLGRVGLYALKLLVREGIDKIITFDCIDKSSVLENIGGDIVFEKTCSVDQVLDRIRGRVDLVATAIPSRVAREYIPRLLKNGLNIVDVSFIDFDPYIYKELCREKNVFYIVDAGFAPGFSNLVIGYLYNNLGYLDKAVIYVGGLPTKPIPPFYYQVTWSAEDLIEEYTRESRIIINGEVSTIDPLGKIMYIEIPSIGVFEGFYSDGLRTLLRNIKAREMYEITIRYRGHLEKIKVLRELGFFDKRPMRLNDYEISPLLFTARLFEEKYKQSIPDRAILFIDVVKNDKYYQLLSILELGDPMESSTAMFTALVFTKSISLALNRDIAKDIIPLEKLHIYFNDYKDYLLRNNVLIKINTNM